MRSILLISLLVLSAAFANAKNLDFFYCKLNRSTLVTCKTNSSNIRKTPSVKAPYLMWGCHDETDDCSFMWSNKADRFYSPRPYQITEGQVVLAANDVKTADFYRICVGSNSDYHFEAYLAKRATKPINAIPITRQELRQEYFGYWIFPESSPLKDVIVALDSDELYGVSNLMLGTIQNGLLIFAHSVPGYFLYDESADGLTCNKDNDILVFTFGPKQCRSLSETSNFHVLDLGKLTQNETEELLLKLEANQMPNASLVRAKYRTPNTAPAIYNIFYGDGGNGDFTAVFQMNLNF